MEQSNVYHIGVRSLAVPAVVLLFVVAAFGQKAGAPLEFPATCAPAAHDEFVQGVIGLHSSSYIEAAEHFRAAQHLDSQCVMAYWGEAMTFNHPFWNQQDIAGARRVLLKLGPTRAARQSRAATKREKEYLNAVEILYGDGDRDARDFGFADAMKKLAMDYPEDYEASAFYVLALLSTHRVGERDYPQKQAAAAAILKAILAKYPEHPGALHYLMHTYDDPEHAALALEAARKYEKVGVGDSNFHAIHMPSHIYMQLGMWPDVVRSNQAAFDASDRWVRLHHLNVAGRDYHSLEFLQYAFVQMGHYATADEIMALMFASAERSGLPGMSNEAAVMAARYAVETGKWDVLSKIAENDPTPEVLFARGLAALHTGTVDVAKQNASLLDHAANADVGARRLVHAANENLLKTLLLSRIALAENRPADADQLGKEAVQLEAGMEIQPELNGIVKPAAEFYGEMLLELHKPDQAALQFAVSLKERPKRALSILGLARARSATHDSVGAHEVYSELAAMWSGADPSLPALHEIRNFLK